MFGVWISLSVKNFERCKELFDAEAPDEPPYFGWLSNRLAGLPDTLSLKTNVVLQPSPSRPYVYLHESEHPLYIAQRDGMSVDEWFRILHAHGAFEQRDE